MIYLFYPEHKNVQNAFFIDADKLPTPLTYPKSFDSHPIAESEYASFITKPAINAALATRKISSFASKRIKLGANQFSFILALPLWDSSESFVKADIVALANGKSRIELEYLGAAPSKKLSNENDCYLAAEDSSQAKALLDTYIAAFSHSQGLYPSMNPKAMPYYISPYQIEAKFCDNNSEER